MGLALGEPGPPGFVVQNAMPSLAFLTESADCSMDPVPFLTESTLWPCSMDSMQRYGLLLLWVLSNADDDATL